MIEYKKLNKLYLGKYQHKIVLVCKGAFYLRGNDLNKVYRNLLSVNTKQYDYYQPNAFDLNYLFEVVDCLQTIDDFKIRIENPYISIYTTNKKAINRIKKIDKSKVRTIYELPKDIQSGEVLSTLPYDYKVYIKNNRKPNDGFINWTQDNKNIRLTKTTKLFLSEQTVWPAEGYFYITGDKNLTMAKIHLGNVIKKIEKIVRE
jgi:uridine kinase